MTTFRLMAMTSISALWEQLATGGEIGGARRVDDVHPSDLYAALDASGHPGLVLVTDEVPPAPPALEAVLVTVTERKDQRHSLGIWLRTPALETPFGILCQDLIDQSRNVDPRYVGGFLLSRLARWRRLLKGEPGLSQSELRGLIGELVVLRRCLDIWPAVEVIEGWLGPYEAAQDFAFESTKIEVKAIQPDARAVRISSADQLDTPGPLLLALVTLVTLLPDDVGRTPAEFVEDIKAHLRRLGAFGEVAAFESRLIAGGFSDAVAQSRSGFRVDGVQFYRVAEGFPAIRRAALPNGVAEVNYDIELSGLPPFASALANV